MVSQEIQNFLNYSYTPFSKKQCIRRLILIWLLSIILIFIGPKQLKWVLWAVSPTAIVSILFFFLIIRYPNLRISRFLCDGVAFLHIAILLMLASYRIVAINRGEDGLLLLIMIMIFVINIILFIIITLHNIANDKFNLQDRNQKISMLPFIFAIGGFLLAQLLLEGKSENTGLSVLASCLMLLSLMLGVGSLNLMKAFYQFKANSGSTD